MKIVCIYLILVSCSMKGGVKSSFDQGVAKNNYTEKKNVKYQNRNIQTLDTAFVFLGNDLKKNSEH
jgi:hypothetical protein